MGSPEPVEDVEELSPDRAIHRVKELITASSDTLYKVQTIYKYINTARDVLTFFSAKKRILCFAF